MRLRADRHPDQGAAGRPRSRVGAMADCSGVSVVEEYKRWFACPPGTYVSLNTANVWHQKKELLENQLLPHGVRLPSKMELSLLMPVPNTTSSVVALLHAVLLGSAYLVTGKCARAASGCAGPALPARPLQPRPPSPTRGAAR